MTPWRSLLSPEHVYESKQFLRMVTLLGRLAKALIQSLIAHPPLQTPAGTCCAWFAFAKVACNRTDLMG